MINNTTGSPAIEFTVLYDDEAHRVRAHPNQYRDLRELMLDNFNLEIFGQCGGNGRCATCMVQINGAPEQLSCQVSVNDELANATVQVSENCY